MKNRHPDLAPHPTRTQIRDGETLVQITDPRADDLGRIGFNTFWASGDPAAATPLRPAVRGQVYFARLDWFTDRHKDAVRVWDVTTTAVGALAEMVGRVGAWRGNRVALADLQPEGAAPSEADWKASDDEAAALLREVIDVVAPKA